MNNTSTSTSTSSRACRVVDGGVFCKSASEFSGPRIICIISCTQHIPCARVAKHVLAVNSAYRGLLNQNSSSFWTNGAQLGLMGR